MKNVAKTLAFIKKATERLEVLKSQLRTAPSSELVAEVAWLADLANVKAAEASRQIKVIRRKVQDYSKKV